MLDVLNSSTGRAQLTTVAPALLIRGKTADINSAQILGFNRSGSMNDLHERGGDCDRSKVIYD